VTASSPPALAPAKHKSALEAPLDRAHFVLGELRSTLEFVFDDGKRERRALSRRRVERSLGLATRLGGDHVGYSRPSTSLGPRRSRPRVRCSSPTSPFRFRIRTSFALRSNSTAPRATRASPLARHPPGRDALRVTARRHAFRVAGLVMRVPGPRARGGDGPGADSRGVPDTELAVPDKDDDPERSASVHARASVAARAAYSRRNVSFEIVRS